MSDYDPKEFVKHHKALLLYISGVVTLSLILELT